MNEYSHNKSYQSRQRQEHQTEDSLLQTFKSYKLFSEEMCDDLQNTATKDVATKEIEQDLLSVQTKGRQELEEFTEERLLDPEARKVQFQDPLAKQKSRSFASLYEVTHKDSKQKNAKKNP